MLTLSLFTAAVGLLVGVFFGAIIRTAQANAEVRIAFCVLLMLCIASMVMLGGASIATLATFFGVSTAVGIALQFTTDSNRIIRAIANFAG